MTPTLIHTESVDKENARDMEVSFESLFSCQKVGARVRVNLKHGLRSNILQTRRNPFLTQPAVRFTEPTHQ